MEPLIGPVTLQPEWLDRLDWVIVGGESGGHARPIHPEWVRSIQKQCQDAGAKFFFKQWGCWSPDEKFARSDWRNVAYFQPGSDEPVLLQGLKANERRAVAENRAARPSCSAPTSTKPARCWMGKFIALIRLGAPSRSGRSLCLCLQRSACGFRRARRRSARDSGCLSL